MKKKLILILLLVLSIASQAQILGNPFVFKPKLLVDSLTATPVIAISFNRIKSDYTGYLVRIRAATSNAEMDVEADGNGWVSLKSPGKVTASGSSGYAVGTYLSVATLVSSQDAYLVGFYNQMDGSLVAYNFTASTQPKVMTGGVFETMGGKPVARFNSANSNFLTINYIGSATSLTGICTYKAFAVPPSSSNGPVLGDFGTDGNADSWTWTDGVFYDGFGRSNRFVCTSNSGINVPNITVIESSSTAYTLRVNSIQKYTTTTGTVQVYSGPHYLARTSKSGSTYYWNGWIGEVIIVKSTINIPLVEANVKRRWEL
ncbi:hypothetical protein FHS57_005157 [Runella defluvii]|uniref:Uncharacterized protein n=1 Tax=Runella defluvii TaxID=370973 RepID=A0A7W5ZS64_9BACT|nr:hypothetical protein [Runella defluvii]MBB3841136.1 hypothetical protein [Runella defluvii]